MKASRVSATQTVTLERQPKVRHPALRLNLVVPPKEASAADRAQGKVSAVVAERPITTPKARPTLYLGKVAAGAKSKPVADKVRALMQSARHHIQSPL